MKRTAPIYLAALASCSLAGPQETSAPATAVSTNTLVLAFQTGFSQTRVELYVDKKLLLDEALTTDQRIGLARNVTFTPRDSGEIDADIIIDRAARYSYSIQRDRGWYIGFSKDLDGGHLKMMQSQVPFEYD